jgi:arsenate reductase
MKILIICTGNSCRSQMAHGFLQSFDKKLDIFSAGTEPATRINATAVKVMNEAAVDISHHTPKDISRYLNEEWDYVITVCDDANETCPYFPGKVKHRLHMGFEDPSAFKGTEEEKLIEFRKIRDEIKNTFYDFYKRYLT